MEIKKCCNKCKNLLPMGCKNSKFIEQVSSYSGTSYKWEPVKIIYPNEFFCAYWEANQLGDKNEKTNVISTNITS